MFEKVYYFITFKLIAYRFKLLKNKLNSCGTSVSIDDKAVILGAENTTIGNNVAIASFVHIWGNAGLKIGDNTLIASHVAITTLTHDKKASVFKNTLISKPIIIGENVWIGSHAIILPGVHIGNNAIIGAGALVNRNVLPNEIVKGLPINKYEILP